MPSWIKIRADLESDPRVHRMAAHIAKSAPGYILTSQAKDLFGSVTDTVTRNALRDVTVMGLSRVWFAANDHTTDGVFRHADLSYLDALAHIPGFGEAMQSVGYAIHDPEAHTVTLPRFVEHNAPDKNGERSKTAAARRAQRSRDKKKAAKAAVEQLTDAENQEQQASSIQDQASNPVTSRVTSRVTQRHEENNVTPSLSSSLSISESKISDSDSEHPVNQVNHRQPPSTPPDPDPLGTLKRRINALRPSWTKTPHWSAEEESALYEARHNLAVLDDQDWHLLAWFFKWANSAQNTGQKDPVKVSARRAHLCHDLAALLDRATTAWKQAGAPRLGDAVTPRVTSRVTPPPAPELPPAENAAAFAGLLAATGVHRHPTVTTKPHAA
jgi:type II secretory pathway pseudopilin PulG